MIIRFQYADTPSKINLDTKQQRKVLNSLFRLEKTKVQQIDYIFCTDEFLLNLNRQFLNHHYYTDVLTFPLSFSPMVAEVYISLDRVLVNAKEYRVTFDLELSRVICHAALHLCGYEDGTAIERKKMRTKENFYLSI